MVVTITSKERVEYSHGDNWLVTRQVSIVTDIVRLSVPVSVCLPACRPIFPLQNEDRSEHCIHLESV